MSLEKNQDAPDFEALDQEGKKRSLKEFKGKWVFVYFYPMDDTPGCTKEACSIRDEFSEIRKHAVVIGVSSDTVKSHQKFANKYQLPFLLISDPDKKVISDYGAKGLLFTKRISYLINPQGKIARAYLKVDPKTHATEVLADLLALVKNFCASF
ncbi:MAG: peroxiredoxin [Deltaproteobacteria bacterium]|nr:peroxiredoxin [Deltaproteobacteria bacterium]